MSMTVVSPNHVPKGAAVMNAAKFDKPIEEKKEIISSLTSTPILQTENANSVNAKIEIPKDAVILNPKEKNDKSNVKISELEVLQAVYIKKTGKNPPPRYKNNIEWLKSKI